MRALYWGVCAVLLIACGPVRGEAVPDSPANLARARIFLAAGDYRRAIEACREEVTEHPSARSYVYLTYVYHAVDAYLDALAKADRWVQVEQLSRSLAPGHPEELLDPSDILARISKELIQESARKQADLTAAMAERLDKGEVAHLWAQQKSWRLRLPDGWWFGVPPEWDW